MKWHAKINVVISEDGNPIVSITEVSFTEMENGNE